MTATPAAARAHARAQAGAAAVAMPTIPARDAVDLPAGVSPEAVLWDEAVAAGGWASRVLPRGSTLRITDVEGDACAAILLHNADQPIERLNVADTVKVQWQAYLGVGSLLLSDMGRVLATVTTDTSGHHDLLCGCSNRAHNQRRYGTGDLHGPCPNARDGFANALAKHGLDRRDIGPCLTLFKGVTVLDDGALRFDGGLGAPAHVELRAEMALLVTVVDSPHVLDPRPSWVATPLRLTAWRGSPTTVDDPLWSATPESERAYQNTEDLHLGLTG